MVTERDATALPWCAPWSLTRHSLLDAVSDTHSMTLTHLLIQRRRAIEALEARAPPPQYCDCGPDWPLLFKVHEI